MQSNSQPASRPGVRRPRLVILATGLAVGVLFLALQAGRLSDRSFLPIKDFVEYWAAGRLFFSGDNPYSWEGMLELEKSVGMEPYLSETGEEMPLMMFNPPWTLAFILPFAQSNFALSRLMWFVFGLGLVILCADMIWRVYGGAPSRRWLAWIIGLSFVPTLQVLQMGQIGPLLLLGVVWFLSIRDSGWMAGVATVLIAIKPHLFGVLATALFLWTVQQRRWSVFLGAAITLSFLISILGANHLSLLAQYLQCIQEHSPRDCRTPILGSLLRVLFGPNQFWLQVIPQIVGLIWVAVYWYRRRNDWDWLEQLPLLVLVSLLTTPYGAWPFDLVVLLLPVIEIAARAQWARRSQQAIVAGVYAAIEIPALALSVAGVDSFYFVWMPPMLLVSYLALRRMLISASSSSPLPDGRGSESAVLIRVS